MHLLTAGLFILFALCSGALALYAAMLPGLAVAAMLFAVAATVSGASAAWCLETLD